MQPGKPNWFAVVSKPRQEQTALDNLQRQGFECFLPMAENPYQRRSKKHKPNIEPLFPIRSGDRVRIFDGPLAGINGVVQATNGNNRALILMELLGRPTRVQVESILLQKTA